MHKIETNIQKGWYHLLQNKTIIVASSGGLDSTVLLYILHKLGYKVIIAHVNYHLRGQESNKDQVFIESFAKKHNILCAVNSIKLEDQLEKGGNLQALAREIRYDWFKELSTKYKADFIALAHHLDDQVETFFFNISRKAGVMGLAAMPAKRDQFIRPLLPFSKDQLYAYAKSEGICWREDASNTSLKYKRNLLRNKLIPQIKKAIPNLSESVEILVNQFQNKQIELEKTIKPFVKETLKTNLLLLGSWTSWDEFEQIEFCRQMSFSPSRANEMTQLLESQKGKRIDLSVNESYDFIVKDVHSFCFINEKLKTKQPKIIIEQVDGLPVDFTKDCIYLDNEKIIGELKIRAWKQGDRIKPIGMKGSSLISDIVSDAKLTPLEKNNVFVLHDDDTIHWCIGLKIGRDAIAKSTSTSIKKVSII